MTSIDFQNGFLCGMATRGLYKNITTGGGSGENYDLAFIDASPVLATTYSTQLVLLEGDKTLTLVGRDFRIYDFSTKALGSAITIAGTFTITELITMTSTHLYLISDGTNVQEISLSDGSISNSYTSMFASSTYFSRGINDGVNMYFTVNGLLYKVPLDLSTFSVVSVSSSSSNIIHNKKLIVDGAVFLCNTTNARVYRVEIASMTVTSVVNTNSASITTDGTYIYLIFKSGTITIKKYLASDLSLVDTLSIAYGAGTDFSVAYVYAIEYHQPLDKLILVIAVNYLPYATSFATFRTCTTSLSMTSRLDDLSNGSMACESRIAAWNVSYLVSNSNNLYLISYDRFVERYATKLA